MNRPKAKFKIGDHCFCEHYYAFRGNAPFKIAAITKFHPVDGKEPRWAYIVLYDSDDRMDAIPVEHEGHYEMRKVEGGV